MRHSCLCKTNEIKKDIFAVVGCYVVRVKLLMVQKSGINCQRCQHIAALSKTLSTLLQSTQLANELTN